MCLLTCHTTSLTTEINNEQEMSNEKENRIRLCIRLIYHKILRNSMVIKTIPKTMNRSNLKLCYGLTTYKKVDEKERSMRVSLYVIIDLALYISSVSSKKLCFISSHCPSFFLSFFFFVFSCLFTTFSLTSF